MNKDEKLKALDAALTQIEKAYGKGSVMKLGDSRANMNIETIPTGSISLDIALGLGYGDNAKAALITRGNAELSRLGIAMGCKAETFAGLSGMGDLIVTCTSMHSRNLHAGMLIGRGKSVEEAKTEVGQVVEGINALPAACRLAKQYKVEMPIVQAVEAILDGKLEARSALMALMGRSLKRE
jgi:glycerol-3-phosphate dehydrogenase (NAD(P)+)